MNLKLQKAAVLVIIFIVCSLQFLRAQTAPEYQVKAVFLYNFTRFIDWPGTAFENDNSPFVIGIIGSDPFGSVLDEVISDEKTGQHPIVIKRFKTPQEIENCQILYINTKDEDQVKTIIAGVKDKNILTVGDATNFAGMGGVIGFFMENNKIRMQINTDAAKSASLNISSKLLSVAKIL